MGRSANYKSPAKLKRNYLRLISRLIKLQKKPSLTFTQNEIKPRNSQVLKSKSLHMSNAVVTNYPEACPVCHQHQCETDLSHSIYFTVFETLANLELPDENHTKPPDENPLKCPDENPE